jgi:predicted NodU family carbamoyl transferase
MLASPGISTGEDLGICHDVFICSACVVVDGVVVSASAEERLDRHKLSRVFPGIAIRRCLKESGLALSDLDEIAVAWNPALELETTPPGYLSGRRSRVEHGAGAGPTRPPVRGGYGRDHDHQLVFS